MIERLAAHEIKQVELVKQLEFTEQNKKPIIISEEMLMSCIEEAKRKHYILKTMKQQQKL